jgi:hypothetical protein
VSKWLGHRSVDTTFATYWDVQPEDLVRSGLHPVSNKKTPHPSALVGGLRPGLLMDSEEPPQKKLKEDHILALESVLTSLLQRTFQNLSIVTPQDLTWSNIVKHLTG